MEQAPDEHLQEAMKRALDETSASVGAMIGLGRKLLSRETRQHMTDKILPYIQGVLPGVPYRVIKCILWPCTFCSKTGEE